MDQKLTFRYFYGNEADQYSFYRIPKLLFKNEYFKNLSSDAKILYGLMLDRMSLSIKNQWFDEQNRAYIYFSIEDIMELLNCGRNKAVKSLQELDDENGIGLIEKRRQGFGKANIIYVKSFMIYEEQEEKPAEEPQKFTKQTNADNLEEKEVYKVNSMKSQKQTSRSPENKLQEVCNSNSNYNNTSDIKESKNKSDQIISDRQRSDVDGMDARLHDKDLMAEQGIEKDRLTKEVEAESVAYCVCSAFGVDTSEYSFPYIAGWSSGRDMKELKTSMDTIRKTAGEMIDELSEKLQELFTEKKLLLESEQKEKLIPAVEAAGYHFDELESSDGNLRFLPDGTHEISGAWIADSWNDVQEWLEGVVLEDPDTAERVERVMHPERFEKTSEELMFDGEERFAIYQIDHGSKAMEYLFMGMDFVKSQGMEVTAGDYQCVYSGILQPSDNLDTLYSVFNQNHPADFRGHSMSVSDVVITNQNGDLRAFYVDSFGFTELPDFVKQRQEMIGIENTTLPLLPDEDKSRISFYVAECSEFPVLGEFHQDLTLEQAFSIFDQIPGNRMNGIKSIGFNLEDDSDYAGMFDLYVGKTLQKEIINSIPGYRDNRLVQKALSDAEKIIEKRQKEREKTESKMPEERQKSERQKTKSQHRREAMSL